MEIAEILKKIDSLEKLVKIQGEELKTLKGDMVLNPKIAEQKEELEVLKALLESAQWPNAVDPSLICDVNNEQDKEDRAEGIIDIIIDVNLEGKTFLDFGCGQGHVVNKSLQYKPKISVGYDIKEEKEYWDKWKNNGNAVFTTDWEEVAKNGPFNVVLLYDVLDHLEENNQVEVLKKIKEVCLPDAKIYVRCHPFCSRHGTHLYQKLNKAFVHLIFTQEELDKLGYPAETQLKSAGVIYPQHEQAKWFNLAGLKVVKHNPYKEPLEPFFKEHPIVSKRIKKIWIHDEPIRTGKVFPVLQMEQQFNDYVLKI